MATTQLLNIILYYSGWFLRILALNCSYIQLFGLYTLSLVLQYLMFQHSFCHVILFLSLLIDLYWLLLKDYKRVGLLLWIDHWWLYVLLMYLIEWLMSHFLRFLVLNAHLIHLYSLPWWDRCWIICIRISMEGELGSSWRDSHWSVRLSHIFGANLSTLVLRLRIISWFPYGASSLRLLYTATHANKMWIRIES